MTKKKDDGDESEEQQTQYTWMERRPSATPGFGVQGWENRIVTGPQIPAGGIPMDPSTPVHDWTPGRDFIPQHGLVGYD